MKQLGLLSYDEDGENNLPEETEEEQGAELETALAETQSYFQDFINDRANQISSLESLNVLISSMEGLIKDSRHAEANAVLQAAKNMYPGIVSSFTMEDLGDSPDFNGDASVAVEGLRQIFDRVIQNYVLNFKQDVDFFHGLFLNTKKNIDKYRGRLNAALDEFNSTSFSSNTNNRLSLNSLWYFFRTEKGQITDMVKALENDIKVNEYILKKYPKDVSNNFSKLSSAIKTVKVTKEEDVVKSFQKLTTLEHPADLFKGFPIKGYPYLDMMGLAMHTTRQAPISIELDKINTDKVRDLTVSKTIKENWNFKHEALVFGSRVTRPGVFLNLILSKSLEYHISDIGTSLKIGLRYINNSSDYLNFLNKATRDIESAAEAYRKLADTGQYEIEGFRSLMITIARLIDNHLNCIKNPAVKELSRSAKAGRYIAYAGRRMIANAK